MKVTVVDALAPWSCRWPDSQVGPWEVTLSWRWAGDRAECAGFQLRPVEDAETEPISATLIRKIPVMKLVSRARFDRWSEAGGEVVEAIDDGQDLDIDSGLERELRRGSESWRDRRRGRPATLNQSHYRAVAEVYSAAHAAGDSPLVAVQNRWSIARPTASRWVAAARERDLLPPTERGRARGNGNLLTDQETQS